MAGSNKGGQWIERAGRHLLLELFDCDSDAINTWKPSRAPW